MSSFTWRYSPASKQTGQSEPNIKREGPNASTTKSRYGRKSAACQECQSASVTRPDSLQKMLGDFASSRIWEAQGSNSRDLTNGFAQWSRTNFWFGQHGTSSMAAGS